MLRRWTVLCTAALLASISVSPAAADPAMPRLRPQSPRVTRWLADGVARSETFRALVARIERGDVIVYLESQAALGRGLSACVTWMGSTPQVRYLRASVRPDLGARDTLAMIAHELQHVVELIDHPDVLSERGLADLYQRIGHPTGRTGDQWDTTAALQTGDRVRTEIFGA
jgi:hypothetical protein